MAYLWMKNYNPIQTIIMQFNAELLLSEQWTLNRPRSYANDEQINDI